MCRSLPRDFPVDWNLKEEEREREKGRDTMAKFRVSFTIDGKKLGDAMEVLVPLKVEDLSHQIVIGTATKIRAGDKPAWQIAAEAADSTPRPIGFFIEKLVRAGFRKEGTYNAISKAVANRVLNKQMIKGAAHYKKGSK